MSDQQTTQSQPAPEPPAAPPSPKPVVPRPTPGRIVVTEIKSSDPVYPARPEPPSP